MSSCWEKRILLGTLRSECLLVGLAVRDPLGHRGAFLVVREMLGQPGGVELEQTRGSSEGIALGIFVELDEAGRDALPIRVGGNHEVALVVQLLPTDEVLDVRGLVPQPDEFVLGPAPGIFLQHPQAVGDHLDDLVIAVRFTQRFDAPLFEEEEVELAAEDVAADIVFFQLGVDRQDHIGEQGVVLQPGMLAEDELDVGVAHGPDEVVAVVPAGDPGG
jgi:hypothetical protein